MSNAKVVPVDAVPRIFGGLVWQLAEEEYRRYAAAVTALDSDSWDLPTDCTAWSVRELCLHVLGSMAAQASPVELLHQFRRGLPLNRRIESHHWVDGLNELQVRERRHLSTAEITAAIAEVAPAAVRGRRRTPPPVRWLPVPFGPPVGWKPLTYLLRVGFTRDVWMHRLDLARAVGTKPELTAAHDGRIVADILAEWATTHDEPFHLMLTGPAGGSYRRGEAPAQELDAVEFCRILSGRVAGVGVLAHPLPL
jgi:uncharacterized protein (TIGR03083 family)